MSFILKHHFPNMALDLDSLRRTCDTLSTPNPPPNRNETTSELPEPSEAVYAAESARLSGSPGIENEDCTIDLVNDTTVRMLSYLISPAAPLTRSLFVMQTTLANFLIGISPCISSAMWMS